LVFAFYAFYIWRIIKKNRGDRLIEFGSITLLSLLLVLALKKFSATPDWLLNSLELFMYLMCLLALGFMFQQSYRAIRRKLAKHDD
jgi:hypothetical protein